MAGFTNNLSLRKKPQTQREKRNEIRDQAKQAATNAKTSNKRPRTITASPVLDYGTPSPKAGNTAQSESSSRKYTSVRRPSFSAAYVKAEAEKKSKSSTPKTYVNPRMKRESTPSSKPAATGGRAAHEGMIPKPTATNTTTGKKNSRPKSANKSGSDTTKTTSAKPTTPTKKNSRPQRAIKSGDDAVKTSSTRKPYYNSDGTHSPTSGYVWRPEDTTKTTSAKTTTPTKKKSNSKSDVSSASAKQTGKSGTNPTSQPSTKKRTTSSPDNTRDIIAQGFTEVKTPTAKKRWNEEEVLKERREAAKAQGKGNWNAEEEMKKRREAAKANGKGNWNAEEEMKKRREAAKANGKGTWNAEEEMRKRREAAAAKKKGGRV